MGVIYGYARCSTNEDRQDINRQKRELMNMGVTDEKYIYWEYESGTIKERTELKKLLDIVREGDTIVATEVSRLTRSTGHLCELMQLIKDKRLCLKINSFTVDCRNEDMDPMTKGMLMMWGVFAEMERDIISQRVKSGIQNAIAKGKRIGRPEVTKEDIPDKFWKYYQFYRNGNLNISEFSRLMECSRTTVYKYLSMAEKSA